ncbi:uncharacterized protein IAS62_001413 [Cryptococcus decagattii]|uniref:Uncharacterized protein n=1 Tax=Cryptococcus decagattii TaxID=1859122 RepID=A0ABZ2ANS7_9TREE
MYWYISFLRPPPVSTSNPDQGITITPQVANDLRTELRYEPTTIYYAWQRVIPSLSSLTTPQELTTFIPPESTYKPLVVPLPKNVQVGESWRLGLFTQNEDSQSSNGQLNGLKGKGKLETTGDLLDLVNDTPNVLGVWSEGIEIARPVSGLNTGAVRGIGAQKEPAVDKGKLKGKSKGKDKEKEKERDDGPKQGRIMREWALPDEGKLRIVEQTSFDLDKKIWDSGLALSAWFWKYLAGDRSLPLMCQKVFTLLKRQEKLTIVELGTGTGLVSIVLSLALKRMASLERNIIATDLESAIPLMDENIALNNLNSQMNNISTDHENGQEEKPKGAIIDAKVLDWDQPIPDWVNMDHPELVIAADVTYNTSTFPSLLSTLTSLLHPSSASLSNRPLLVLAYKERDPAERELWGMLKERGIDMVMVDEIKGAEDYGSIEIWIGRSNLL